MSEGRDVCKFGSADWSDLDKHDGMDDQIPLPEPQAADHEQMGTLEAGNDGSMRKKQKREEIDAPLTPLAAQLPLLDLPHPSEPDTDAKEMTTTTGRTTATSVQGSANVLSHPINALNFLTPYPFVSQPQGLMLQHPIMLGAAMSPTSGLQVLSPASGFSANTALGALPQQVFATGAGNSLWAQTLMSAQLHGQGIINYRPVAPSAASVATGQQSPGNPLGPPSDRTATGQQPVVLFMNCDVESLSEYQCLVRKQIELFEALRDDVETNAQGRNRPIVLGQVGIRCRHCSTLPAKQRARGAAYYPARLTGLYQAAQNMATCHLAKFCPLVPTPVRDSLQSLRECKSSAGGGKKYWADGARVLGVHEDSCGLRFASTR